MLSQLPHIRAIRASFSQHVLCRSDRRPKPQVGLQPERLETRVALAVTVGLQRNVADQVAPGYTLLGHSLSPRTYLVDTSGQMVHSWTGNGGQTSSYLLPNGNLLRNTVKPSARTFGNNGATGRIEELAWDSSVVWSFELSAPQNKTYSLHHDAISMPNGNVLAIAWEKLSFAEAVAAGRNPVLTNPAVNREIWSEAIFEIKPDYTTGSGGEIVWEWHLTDHLVQDFDSTKANYRGPSGVRNNPQLVNFNYVPRGAGSDTHIADWAHFNAIAYNATTDQILVSSRELSEVFMIDHGTTTAEAAGHTGGRYGKGGDLLWRYGNPATWKAGMRPNQSLYFQHNVQWIAEGLPGAGNILIFNNGWNRYGGESYSSVVEVSAFSGRNSQLRYGHATPIWSYVAKPNSAAFFAPIVSGAQRLGNGNTLIDEGTRGRIFEVTRSGRIVWQYVNPDTRTGPVRQGTVIPLLDIQGLRGTPNVRANLTFRALRYAPDYQGLAGKTLAPLGRIER